MVSWSLAPRRGGRARRARHRRRWRRASRPRGACVAAGYKVGVHFDPHDRASPAGRRAIAISSRRSPPRCRSRASPGSAWARCASRPGCGRRCGSAFPGTPLLAGEQVPGVDGKWRDFQPLRVDMYRRVRALRRGGAARRAALSLHGDARACGSASSATPPPAGAGARRAPGGAMRAGDDGSAASASASASSTPASAV